MILLKIMKGIHTNIKIQILNHERVLLTEHKSPADAPIIVEINDNELTFFDPSGFEEATVLNDVNKSFQIRYFQLQKIDLKQTLMKRNWKFMYACDCVSVCVGVFLNMMCGFSLCARIIVVLFIQT